MGQAGGVQEDREHLATWAEVERHQKGGRHRLAGIEHGGEGAGLLLRRHRPRDLRPEMARLDDGAEGARVDLLRGLLEEPGRGRDLLVALEPFPQTYRRLFELHWAQYTCRRSARGRR